MPADPNVPKQHAFASLQWSENRLLLLVQNAPFVKGKMLEKGAEKPSQKRARKIAKTPGRHKNMFSF